MTSAGTASQNRTGTSGGSRWTVASWSTEGSAPLLFRSDPFSYLAARTSRSQDVVPRRPGPPQSEQRSPCGKVGTRRPAGRRHDGPLCRVRAAHPGPVPPQRAGPSLARQVRAVLRLQLQPHREVLLQGREALLQNGLFQVTHGSRTRTREPLDTSSDSSVFRKIINSLNKIIIKYLSIYLYIDVYAP